MTSSRKQWSDFSPKQRAAVLTLAAAEVAFTATAAVDLVRRPADGIKGGKRLWWLLIFVQPFGPLTYLFWARRRS